MDGAEEHSSNSQSSQQHHSHTTTTNRRSSRLSISTTAADLQSAQSATPTAAKGKKKVTIDESSSGRKSQDTPATASSSTPASGPSQTSDRKGKKRATSSTASLSTDIPPPVKRAKRNSESSVGSSSSKRYDLRAKPESQSAEPSAKDSKSTGKGKKMAPKTNPKRGGTSNDRSKKGDTSARHLIGDDYDEDDSMWVDEDPEEGDVIMDDEEMMRDDYDHDDDEDDDEDDEENEGGGLNFDEATAALFGSGFRVFGGGAIGGGLSKRLQRLKKKLRSKNIATRLASLRECSELLLVSNEDTLGGVFSPGGFAAEFIAILRGEPNIEEGESDEEESNYDEMDEDAQLAAALALSSGGDAPAAGIGGEEEELECQLVACRCLAHMMEALHGCGHTLVHHGAVPVLCSKLQEISYIELAEQTLSTLEKISAEYPSAIVREDGLGALLNFLPFFSTNVQRTAVTAAANCCRNISPEHYHKIKAVFPTLRDTLSSGEPRLVEQATLAILRTIESYRHNAGHLEGLLDHDTIAAVNVLLMPSAGSPLITPPTYTHLLKALTTSARGSARVAIGLLEAGMTGTIYQILTGVLPPSHDEDEQGGSSGGQGLAGGVADMAILQNLAHRPKEQVEEALALICELLPPVPRDGVFDARMYSEKNLHKVKKGRKIESSADRVRRSTRVAEATSGNNSASNSAGPSTPAASGEPSTTARIGNTGDVLANLSASREAAVQKAKKELETQMQLRYELCKANLELISTFVKTVVPVLVDVYAASVVLRVRTKVLVGLLKAIAFTPADQLRATLRCVPMASFLCAIISSKDNDTFVLHALQIVELLTIKLPDVYQVSFLREGVVFEIENLAREEMNKEKASAGEKATGKPDESSSTPKAVNEAQQPQDVPRSLQQTPQAADATLPNPLLLASIPSTPVPKKQSSTLDPRDSNIVRARMLIARKVFDAGGENQLAASKVLSDINGLVKKLCVPHTTEPELRETLRSIASQFSRVDQGLSSFELLQSGLVDGILEFVEISGEVSSADRRAMFFEIFSNTSVSTPNPLTILVKRLHESLGRLENFEVETAFGGGTDPMRPSNSGVHRTLRVRLCAEGDDIPKNVSQLVITIQAIASVKAVHDYLRPRIADGNFGGGGLSQMFAAYAAGRGGGGNPSRLLDALMGASREGSAAAGGSRPIGQPPFTSASQSTGSGLKLPERRRSARLNPSSTAEGSEAPASAPAAENSARGEDARPASPAAAAAPAPEGAPEGERAGMPSLPIGMDFGDDEEDDYSEDEFEAPVIDQVMEEDLAATGPTESVVNMNVTPDGTRVEAKTPQGTRIATPQQSVPASASAGPGPSTSATSRVTPSRTASGSYAGALKTEPTDWHLEFSLDGKKLDMEDIVYGAVFREKHLAGSAAAADFTTAPTIKFRKVEGPAPVKETKDPSNVASSPASAMSALPEEPTEPTTPTWKILHLLRVVHDLSVEGRENIGDVDGSLVENLFVNNKLTAKLTRQLEEILIIASNCLPEWATSLPKHFAFLFPFDARYNFLQLTAFGFSRLLLKAQQAGGGRHRDDLPSIANLLRRKVRISRNQLLESCGKVMEMYATFPGTLEVEYFDEIGTGLGPTLEFYALASKEFARRNLKIWRDEDSSLPGGYVHHPHGLFPSPLSGSGDAVAPRLRWFKTLGLFIGRSMLDSRIIDIGLSKIFFKLLLGRPVKKNITTLKAVDPQLARSLERLQAYSLARKEIDALPLPASSRRAKIASLTVSGAKLGDLALDFTLPGYNIELKPGGAHIEVDDGNLDEYLELVLDWTLGSGVSQQVKAFQEGFSGIFPIKSLKIFSLEELQLVFGNAEEDWSRETLEQTIKADHGYNSESRAVQNLIEVMSSYTKEQRRHFLQFISMTGAPKLPIGGFRGFTPPFTVVRKPHEPPYKADDYLPSVMTCALYLKMPDYSTKEVLAAQFDRAMRDGKGSFLLS
ncbi:hypothetical protein IAR50_002363 [Cryptococcus sp. DSM 104548]